MKNAIKCNDVSKYYDEVQALKDVNISFEENKVYGILGRNGAGKTTLLKILSGQLFCDGGTIEVAGELYSKEVRLTEKLCFIRENGIYPKDFKIKDIFSAASELYPNWDGELCGALTREFDIDVSKKYWRLSKGMKTIPGLIIGLACGTPVVIYDEPYLGLDAAIRQKFYDVLIREYCNCPRTIIISTHLIDEMSKIFERAVILHKGKVLLDDDVEEILDKSLFLTGNKEIIDKYVKDRRVLNIDNAGNVVTAAVFDRVSLEERKRLLQLNMNISQIPLEKLFIYMTEN